MTGTAERPFSGPPGELTSYVERRHELDAIRGLLGTSRLVTLTGPGGVGKTRLAAQVARRCARAFPDGVLFVELAEVHRDALLPHAVADRSGLQDHSGVPTTDVLLERLRHVAVLLVLDNCEHLVAAAAEFAQHVLSACPRVVVLATSRCSLGACGEQIFAVPPLPVPEDSNTTVRKALSYPSVQLFQHRAAAVDPQFTITDANCGDVIRLCRRLDGLPLAIELAAARTRSLSPRQIADRLTGSLALLTTGPRTAPERHQSLRTTILWSHQQCSEAERTVWARISVFAGSFDLEAAEHVCGRGGIAPGDVLDLVDALVDKSILVREAREDHCRYRMLEVLREFGHEQLQGSGERYETLLRHREWFDQLTRLADAQWAETDQAAWIARLGGDHPNLRAALDWSIREDGETGAALRLASRLHEYWTIRGLDTEAQMWLGRALDAAPADHPDRPLALSMCALHALWVCDPDTAQARLAEADAPTAEDTLLTAHLTYVRSLAALFRLDPRAAGWAAAAAAGFRAHGDARRELHPLFIQGVAAAFDNDLGTARQVLHRMVDLTESYGGTHYRSMAWFGLALVEVEFGDIGIAADAALRGFVAATTIDSTFGAAYHLDVLAWVADRQGEHERAAQLFGAAAAHWTKIGARPEIVLAQPHRRHSENSRRALGAERFATLFETGKRLPAEVTAQYATGRDLPSAVAECSSREAALTKRELEIATLVAQGMTNRDIAARLVISVRTATTHIQHILTKLGFTNRAQIAAWAADRTADGTRG